MEYINFSLVVFSIVFLILFGYELSKFFPPCEDGKISLLVIYLLLFVSTVVIGVELSNTPQAIDVYRGNTTLEITSVDGIPTDTVVIWKNKK